MLRAAAIVIPVGIVAALLVYGLGEWIDRANEDVDLDKRSEAVDAPTTAREVNSDAVPPMPRGVGVLGDDGEALEPGLSPVAEEYAELLASGSPESSERRAALLRELFSEAGAASEREILSLLSLEQSAPFGYGTVTVVYEGSKILREIAEASQTSLADAIAGYERMLNTAAPGAAEGAIGQALSASIAFAAADDPSVERARGLLLSVYEAELNPYPALRVNIAGNVSAWGSESDIVPFFATVVEDWKSSPERENQTLDATLNSVREAIKGAQHLEEPVLEQLNRVLSDSSLTLSAFEGAVGMIADVRPGRLRDLYTLDIVTRDPRARTYLDGTIGTGPTE